MEVTWASVSLPSEAVSQITLRSCPEYASYFGAYKFYRVNGVRMVISPVNFTAGNGGGANRLLKSLTIASYPVAVDPDVAGAGNQFKSNATMTQYPDYKTAGQFRTVKKYVGVKKFMKRHYNFINYQSTDASISAAATAFVIDAGNFNVGDDLAIINVTYFITFKNPTLGAL